MLFTNTLLAQIVSPFYPVKELPNGNNDYLTQITFYEFNFVSINHQNFMIYDFEMGLNEDKSTSSIKKGKGQIINAFIERSAMERDLKELIFDYKVFTTDSVFVIESLKITGSPSMVLKFYVQFWETNLNFDNVKGKEIVTNRHIQDRVSYSFNNGAPSIEVKNTSYGSPDDFIIDYRKKKASYKLRLKQKDIDNKKSQQKLDSVKKINDLKRNTNNESFTFKVVKKKRKIIIEQVKGWVPSKRKPADFNLREKINNYFKNKEKGEYILKVDCEIIYDKLDKIDFKIEQYVKPLFGM